MKKLVLTFAIFATIGSTQHLLAQRLNARTGRPLVLPIATGVDPLKNGYISLKQSATGVDVTPTPAAGVDTLEYSNGALSLVHNAGAASPVATLASTVAKAYALAAVPTPCPAGQAVNAMDAMGNAAVCVSIVSAPPLLVANQIGAVSYAYSQPAIQAGDTISDQNHVFASQGVIAANSLAVGTVVDIDASGTYDINTMQEPGMGIVWLRIGNRIAASNVQTLLVMGRNYTWTAHCRAIIRSTGVNGTLDSSLVVASSSNPYGGRTDVSYFNPTAGVDTTAPQPVLIEFIGGSSADSATLRQLTVTVH